MAITLVLCIASRLEIVLVILSLALLRVLKRSFTSILQGFWCKMVIVFCCMTTEVLGSRRQLI